VSNVPSVKRRAHDAIVALMVIAVNFEAPET
jgi:hypothetical protein